MNDNFQHLILGRLHEVSQLYVDRVVDFITSDKFRSLPPESQAEIRIALEGVTSALSLHTMAVLGVADRNLQEHLPGLFERLQRLSTICKPLGIPPMEWAFQMYRGKLVEAGLDYLGTNAPPA